VRLPGWRHQPLELRFHELEAAFQVPDGGAEPLDLVSVGVDDGSGVAQELREVAAGAGDGTRVRQRHGCDAV